VLLDTVHVVLPGLFGLLFVVTIGLSWLTVSEGAGYIEPCFLLEQTVVGHEELVGYYQNVGLKSLRLWDVERLVEDDPVWCVVLALLSEI
jgi:hypothetical protein